MDERGRVDGVRRRGRDQQRIAVGLGVLDLHGADRAGSAALVVDDHGLAQQVSELVGEHAADDVGRSSGRERHDETDSAIGKLGIGARNSGRRQRADAGRKQLTAFYEMPSCKSVDSCKRTLRLPALPRGVATAPPTRVLPTVLAG
jgi:hypothetical protein